MHVSRCNSYRSFVGTQSLFLGKILALKMSRAPIEARHKNVGTTRFAI
ncbi:hypothetical protein LEP1GSC059_2923 [Leptospira noguchii serovar Panama str. CZ214]|uniref:Uncharacterized protein n=1 Tax=Leptospira noguchii serovar Panama str. CZ214 TaxID=1001595 RepID=T0GR42_9LEPT|nr:hypothetical protein LEP1GSC059_2923 [Leptospira noguchii serovar Panama str. CZ214]